MKENQLTLTSKQAIAFRELNNPEVRELLFGGGACGGKTRLGCLWLLCQCMNFSGTRWVMARKVLKRLKESTLITFFQVCREYGVKANEHFVYNSIDGYITFLNGSVILLKELFNYPTDPEFESLGSLEITGAFVDEVSEVSKKAVMVLKTRCGRWKNKEYGLKPKCLYSCNPSKSWVYMDFYKPFKENKLDKTKRFIQALVKDNPYAPQEYVENLKSIEDQNLRERLLNGNWEYDDDPSVLMEYETILDLFTNKVDSGDKYISCDVARFGDDRTVICVWEGLACKKIHAYRKLGTDEVTKKLEELTAAEQIRRSHVIIDEDGIGGGVVDQFKGCKGFVNNSSAIKTIGEKNVPNYSNLKTQCYFKFSQLAKSGKISIEQINIDDKEALIEELGQVKQKDIDKDGKISLIGKETIKENIGRSPDIADALMMRMYFELNKPNITAYFVTNET